MKIRIGFYIICTALVFLLFACANAVAPNSPIDDSGIPHDINGDNPLAPFAGSYSSSDGTYNFNDDGTGTMGGANPSARSAGGRTPFTWEIIGKDANNANLTYGMLYVGNTGSGITFNTGGAATTVLINDKEYRKGGVPNGGQQGGQQDNDDEPDDSTDDDNSGSGDGTDDNGDGSQDGSSSGGQQGSGNDSQGDGGQQGSGSNTPNSGTPESTPTDIGNGMKRLFAPGVTMTSGWHDANKTPNGYGDVVEQNLCWAATSANVIAWWQDRYNELNPASKISNELPQNGQSVFQRFKEYWSDNTHGGFGDGIPWYFVGISQSDKRKGGGFLLDYTTANKWIPYPTAYKQKQNFASLEEFSQTVIDGLKKGAIAFGIVKNGAGYGHAITLWGVEYDQETNLVKKVYVTDSDVINGSSLESYAISYSGYVTISGHPFGYDRVSHILILYAP